MMSLLNKSVASVLILLLSLTSAGCAHKLSYAQIREHAAQVHVLDGVDEVEATLIAQNFLLRRGLYDRLVSLEPYRSTFQQVWYKDGEEIEYAIAPTNREGVTIEETWTLLFKDKRHTFLKLPVVPFRVVIDAQNGDIVSWGMDKLGEIHDHERIRTDSHIQREDEEYFKTIDDVLTDEERFPY